MAANMTDRTAPFLMLMELLSENDPGKQSFLYEKMRLFTGQTKWRTLGNCFKQSQMNTSTQIRIVGANIARTDQSLSESLQYHLVDQRYANIHLEISLYLS